MRKDRFAELKKIGDIIKTTNAAALVRMLDLRGFDLLERQLLLYAPRRGEVLSPTLETMISALSVETFGITARGTEFVFPHDYESMHALSPARDRADRAFEAHEDRFETTHATDDETVDILKPLGLDFSDDRGFPLRCTMYFRRQAEAAAKGIAGHMPDVTALSVDRFENNLAAQVRAFIAKKGRR